MKFATWKYDGKEEAGILSAGMQSVHSFVGLGMHFLSLLDFIQRHSDADLAALRSVAEKPGIPLSGVQLLAPIPKPHHDVICLGLNYMDHVQESMRFDISVDSDKRDDAVYFSKRVVRALGPDGIIENHFGINERLDYEAELGIIIGKDARNVGKEDAWKYVFGLCCFNDLSARDLQTKHKQWYFGKSLDTFTAYGPYIATIDEFATPLRLRVTSRINGETRQDSTTANLIFTPEHIIAELSAGLTLDAGTIIATGTPAGVGAGFTPHRCMKSGDVCEIEVEGCGVLRNTVG
ncbi:MAG: fumarylacetoacetate hydrolase family protein [Spirochaetaceae bacterium]|jgi:2-keto-4-pentenoate hydratase/2-oxohepta-3-ene-1,7-dioic acid hydratase in catechol pathway|nr:fumarylacetoacetate hydrolase family protein [Spirochaetaceae bacterium]